MFTLELKGAFLGEELEYKENVNVEIDKQGNIIDVYERRSGKGSLIALPALTNAHIHSADYAFLETGNSLSLENLVAPPSGLKHKLLASVPPEKIKSARKEVVKLSKRAGVARLVDFVEKDPREAKVRMKGFQHLILGRPQEGISVDELYKFVDGIGLPDVVSYSKEELRALGQKFRDKIVMVHVSETKKLHEIHDLEISIETLKPRAVVHATFLEANEIKMLAEEKIGAVLCPRSNLWFSVGSVPKIDVMLEEGVLLALGTDNAGWLKPDIWREMEVAALILRQQNKNFNKPLEILKMSTLNPIKMLGLSDISIKRGSRASILLLDSRMVGIEKAGDPAWAIVKRGGPEAVVGVVNHEAIRDHLLDNDD